MIKLFLLLTIATIVAAQTQLCADQPDRTLLPLIGNCTHYCSCKGGKDYILPCGGEYLFDRRLSICNWPSEVPDCTTECVPDDDVHNQPSALSCQEYFLCREGQALIQDCGEGYLFDKTENACNLAELVTDCDGEEPGVTEEPKNPCTGASDGQKVPGSTCSTYWWCLGEEAIGDEQECSDGLHFSPTIQECVEPAEAGCTIT